jgi:hypothetical protein
MQFELTIFEYEDTCVLGTFQSERSAEAFLGSWLIDHAMEQGPFYPKICQTD